MATTAHPADSHAFIQVRGARENNLRDINVDIPKRRLTAVTGVSGSGKSSLVFGTIAAESQRLINETYPAFVQGFMASAGRPEADLLEGITTAIAVDQESMGANPRSTVGTATDVNAMLRTLFSRLAQPPLDGPRAYSFNVPSVEGIGVLKTQDGKREKKTFKVTGGMCPACEGTGQHKAIDLTQLYDESKSLEEGAITIPGYVVDGWYVKTYAQSGFLDPKKPIRDYTEQELKDFLYKEPTKVSFNDMNLTYEGLVPKIQKSMLSKDPDAMQPHIRAFVDRAVTYSACPECDGTRLNDNARSSKIDGLSIADVCAMQVSELAQWVRGISDESVAPVVDALQKALDSFVEIGLGYLSMDRPTGTLSGGESQRTKMIRHLGSALTDVTYVFDEPSVGLHPHDMQRMNGLLLQLRDKGNTVLVVEHKPEMIQIADHIIDMGPGAGVNGGDICFEGTVEDLRKSDTVTGRHLDDKVTLKKEYRKPSGFIEIRGANLHNLQDVDVDIPLGVLTVVTGVAGSGKSSLVHGSLIKSANVESATVSKGEQIISIDQGAIRGSRRSNPATYTGILDGIRKAFAKANGVKPSLFSANSEGACPVCKGLGVIFTELGFMETVSSPCDVCEGRRFESSVLQYKLGGSSDNPDAGRDISEVYAMSVKQAHVFFSEGESRIPAVAKTLGYLVEVGLGYLKLGQPLSTLSGGERQRIKLATHLVEKGGIYVLDEPTTGLHLADIERLLALFERIIEKGKSVILIEHHQAVMARADWIIDLGPGAGHDGGRVVFEGTPRDLVDAALSADGTVSDNGKSLTGEHLAQYVTLDA